MGGQQWLTWPVPCLHQRPQAGAWGTGSSPASSLGVFMESFGDAPGWAGLFPHVPYSLLNV